MERSILLLATALVAILYEAILLFTPLLAPYRFPIPYAVPIFDSPFALMAIGVAYLCLERHRLRQDAQSAVLGMTLWVAGLLALAHIFAQPDYPGVPGVNAGVAPYFFFLSYFFALTGLALAAHYGDHQLPLSDGARFKIVIGLLVLSVVIVIAVLQVRPILPSLVMLPGRMTPFAIWVAGIANGLVGIWALWGGRRKLARHEAPGSQLLLFFTAFIWLIGLIGFLLHPYRYAISWYVAGVVRPIGVGLIFVGLLREQVWLYREARARLGDLEGLHRAGQALVRSLDPARIVSTIAAKALEVSRADAAILFRLDADAGILRAAAGAGQVSPDLVVRLEVALGQGASGLAAAEGRAVWSSNLHDDPRVPVPDDVKQRMRREGLRSVLAVPLLIQSGEVFGALAVFYRSERTFAHADVELLSAFGTQASVAIENARSFAELQETQAQLIQADKLTALGTLLSGMAHELNNPLSTIEVSIELMKRQASLPGPVRARLDVVEKECERASQIIRSLLVFARRTPPERRPVDVTDVIRAALALQAPEFDLNHIRVVTALDPMPRIWADPHQLQQVLLNLFSNAVHAMKSAHGRGVLTVRSSDDGATVSVAVEDDGPGIPAAHLGRIFDPFFTTKAAGEGTGLGLSLSFGIVESHGGRISAENIAGAGARFTVTLPVAERSEVAEAAPSSVAPATRCARVLVVDDEDQLRKLVTEVVIGLGHQVEETPSGLDAIARLASHDYDVVLLDVRLPDLDGKAIWRRLLVDRPTLAARIVFMTGDTMSAETQAFLMEAGRPVLTKPLTIERIQRAVNEALTAPSVHEGAKT